MSEPPSTLDALTSSSLGWRAQIWLAGYLASQIPGVPGSYHYDPELCNSVLSKQRLAPANTTSVRKHVPH